MEESPLSNEEEVTEDDNEEEAPEEDESKEVTEAKPELVAANEKIEQYETIFASPEDAEQAVKALEYYNELGGAMLQGNAEQVLSEIAKANPEGASEFCRNLLPALSKMNPEVYAEISIPIVKNALRAALADAARGSDDDSKQLMYAAKRLSKWLFNDVNVPPDTRRAPDPARQQLEQERQELHQERATTFYNELTSQTIAEVEELIEDKLDPNNAMSTIAKDATVEKIKVRIAEVLKEDRVFQRKMDSLRQRAQAENFNRASAKAIYDLYMAKFKAVMPGIRIEVRKEALKTGTKKSAPVQNVGTRKMPGTGVPKSKREVDWSKTTQAQFLRDEITYK